MNRLGNETSPYLLQHAHNPVDWYAWGPEAFEAARKQNKPIFLSVGYSTCYWCHVMERQSFENADIAKQMNERFICIKVDREERPDVDQLYMTAVQVLTRQGGWPMSVFLTPDLRPFFGGTYFPPQDAGGRPGFPTVLEAISDAYHNRHDDVEKSATQVLGLLRQVSRLVPPQTALTLDGVWVDRMIDRSISDYEPKFGGFGQAPKFPRQTQLELLLAWLASDPSVPLKTQSRVRQMVAHTLDAMAFGGIRDQLGGGFHRYSTDAKWLVPHFEIMLYDQAMLGYVYAKAFTELEESRYAGIARGVFDFILREMASPTGAFYTALDAEVDGMEGQNYLWTREEVRRTLTDEPGKGTGAPFSEADADLFTKVYGLDLGPNFEDPHHSKGQPESNILYLADVRLADENEPLLKRMRDHLLEARRQRKQPLLDTKIITSWNAMMIRALAYGGKVLKEPRYTNAAAAAADFLLREHRTDDGGLYRTSRDGKKKFAAFLDDYAFLADALLALHDATGDAKWKSEAEKLTATMLDRFSDDAGGLFFTAKSAADLLVRQKIGTDSPLPSGNAVAIRTLLSLGQTELAKAGLSAFAQQVDGHGEGMSAVVQSVQQYIAAHGPLEIAAGKVDPNAPPSAEDIAAKVVTIGARWDGPATLRLILTIAPGYHLNANPAGEGLIATDVTIEGTTIRSVDYPPAKMMTFPYAENPIPVFEGEVPIVIHFAAEATGRMTITLTYQPCTADACLPPVRKRTGFEV